MGEQQNRVWTTEVRLPGEMTLDSAASIAEKIRELGNAEIVGIPPEVSIRATIEESTLAAFNDANVHDYDDYDVRVGYDLAFVIDEWEDHLAAIGYSEVVVPRPEIVV